MGVLLGTELRLGTELGDELRLGDELKEGVELGAELRLGTELKEGVVLVEGIPLGALVLPGGAVPVSTVFRIVGGPTGNGMLFLGPAFSISRP